MAIGSDMRLPKPAGGSPLQQSFAPRAPQISDSTVQGMVNNQIASAGGAGRMAALSGGNTKGVSFGRGGRYRADMAQAAADSQAQLAAAKTEMDAANANAESRFASESAKQNEMANNASLLEQMRNSRSMADIARSGWRQDLYETLRRGQLGLDSQYLDYTPLLGGLLR